MSDGDAARQATASTTFRLARALFGGLLAFMALDNLRNLEGRIQYADAKGVPEAERAVPAATGSLLFGGIGIALWKLPTLAAGAVATFLAGVTPTMHDFWNEEEPQQEQIQFLKNAALLGSALAFLKIGREE
ncbi:DoxX family protein [Halorussus halophilus]|uniref:DoxX family protein n=1 Tax=Halorussus halophilus TaxID=2650975 RepID=UPI001300FA17|nr:DoxX family membrane protein [Halorussus halophilus]